MNADDLEAHLEELGFELERARTGNNREFTVVRDVTISKGGLRGKTCDVAIRRVTASPYVLPAAIHTRPALVRMDMSEPLKTQQSGLGAEWQYWSRRFDRSPTPQRIWTHILTVLGDERWEPV